MDLLREADLSKSEIARALAKEKPTMYLNDLMKKVLKNGYVVYTILDKLNSRCRNTASQ